MTETCAAAGSYASALWEKTKANYADSIEMVITEEEMEQELDGEGVNERVGAEKREEGEKIVQGR